MYMQYVCMYKGIHIYTNTSEVQVFFHMDLEGSEYNLYKRPKYHHIIMIIIIIIIIILIIPSSSLSSSPPPTSPSRCAQVTVNGMVITRDSLVNNELILTTAINYISSRVSVPVVYLHLQSFYEYISVPMNSAMASTYDLEIHLSFDH